MLLYPRLPAPTARVLVGEIGDLDLEALARGSATRHAACVYAPTGGSRVDERRIVSLQQTLREIAGEHGYPSAGTRGSVGEFDRAATLALHSTMDIVPADAAQPGVWAFLTCVVVPDIACWRFPRRTPERLEGGIRNTLGRLWWRAHLLDTPAERLTDQLGEDELVQIMERRDSVLGNPRVARAVARTHLRLGAELGVEGRMNLLRDAAKRLLRLSAVITMDAFDEESLEGLADEVLRESASALDKSAATDEGTAESVVDADDDRPPVRGFAGATERRGGVVSAASDHAVLSEVQPIGRQTAVQGHREMSRAAIRRTMVDLAKGGCPDLDTLISVASDRLGFDSTGQYRRDLVRLARSAQHRGWLDIDDDSGRVVFRANPDGIAAEEGQLMRHSLDQISAVIRGISDTDEAGFADEVVEQLGYAPPAGPAARELIEDVRASESWAGNSEPKSER